MRFWYDSGMIFRPFGVRLGAHNGSVKTDTSAFWHGIWWYLAGIWWYLTVSRGIWRSLAVFDGLWRYRYSFCYRFVVKHVTCGNFAMGEKEEPS